jgi:hypothetical protein
MVMSPIHSNIIGSHTEDPIALSTTTAYKQNSTTTTTRLHPSLPWGRHHHHHHTHTPHNIKLINIPWGEMFTNNASLALLYNAFVQGWVGLSILNETPYYLHSQLGMFYMLLSTTTYH